MKVHFQTFIDFDLGKSIEDLRDQEKTPKGEFYTKLLKLGVEKYIEDRK